MKKNVIKFTTKTGDLHLKEDKILAIKQEKEGSDWYVIAYKFTDRFVHHYDVLIIPDSYEPDFLQRWGLSKKYTNVTPLKASNVTYWGGNCA